MSVDSSFIIRSHTPLFLKLFRISAESFVSDDVSSEQNENLTISRILLSDQGSALEEAANIVPSFEGSLVLTDLFLAPNCFVKITLPKGIRLSKIQCPKDSPLVQCYSGARFDEQFFPKTELVVEPQ